MQLLSKKTLRMLLTAKNALFQLLVLAKAKFSVSFFSSTNKWLSLVVTTTPNISPFFVSILNLCLYDIVILLHVDIINRHFTYPSVITIEARAWLNFAKISPSTSVRTLSVGQITPRKDKLKRIIKLSTIKVHLKCLDQVKERMARL